MDVQKGYRLIFDYLKNVSDIYNPAADFKKLDFNILKETPQSTLPQDWEIEIALEAVLNEMTNEKIFKKVVTGVGKTQQTYYVITESLIDGPVHLELSKETADNVKKVYQGILPMISLDAKYNPKEDVSEFHIAMLLEAISFLSKQCQELQK